MLIPHLHLFLPVLSAMWILNCLAAPALTLSSQSLDKSAPTESAVFNTVYWSYSDSPDITEPAKDGLPPVASVFSAMAYHTTLPPSPSPAPQHSDPGVVVVEVPTTTVEVGTCPEAFKRKLRKFRILAVVLGTVASLEALMAVCFAIIFCGRSSKKSIGGGGRTDWWSFGEKRVDEYDKPAGNSWWVRKVVEIHTSPSDHSTVLLSSCVAPASPRTLSYSHSNPDFPTDPDQINQQQKSSLRQSTSAPLLRSPPPTIRNSAGPGKMTLVEFLASLNLDRTSIASTTSSFTTAETHPHWTSHMSPETQTESSSDAYSHTQCSPSTNRADRDSGRKSQESSRSEWDIPKWHSSATGSGSRHNKAVKSEASEEWDEVAGLVVVNV